MFKEEIISISSGEITYKGNLRKKKKKGRERERKK